MLTEKEAWLKLAGCWERPNPTHHTTIYCVVINAFDCAGLCTSIDAVRREISLSVAISMREKIRIEKTLHIGGYGRFNAYIWPQTQDGALMRVGFCRSMADAIS